MDSWPHHGLDDDLRPRMAALLEARRPFALVTVFAADGGPRGVGAQMVVSDTDSWGFVSGGCIEGDVTLHARQTLSDGETRRLVYGRGSPWIDTRLPCGGRLDLLVERVEPDDAAVIDFAAAYADRRLVRYQTDGAERRCVAAGPDAAQDREGRWTVDHEFAPPQRLIVVGSDPIALAIVSLGAQLGWSSVAVWPHGPDTTPAPGVGMRTDSPATALAALAPDAHTAIAIATHDQHDDEAAILAALTTPAGYIGVLGARRRIPDRVQRLQALGATDADIERLQMPIGLPLGAAAPWEIAVSVAAAIIAARRGA
jgi:xanthine dehydrogenase accessory factor